MPPETTADGAAIDEQYRTVYRDASRIVDVARNAAVRSVNAAMTAAYWMIGQRIVEFEQSGAERAAYGAALLGRLAADLSRRFGRGFSRQNLQQMRQFYLAFRKDQICQTASGISANRPREPICQTPSGKFETASPEAALLWFAGAFANWDLAAHPIYLRVGRELVRAAHGDEAPLVVDPFAGGGSIPLEALRLGCEAFASDLNPVACLILKVMLQDIPRRGPGLADDLRRAGGEVRAGGGAGVGRPVPGGCRRRHADRLSVGADGAVRGAGLRGGAAAAALVLAVPEAEAQAGAAEPIAPEEVAFEEDVFLLTKARAEALRRPAPEPSPTPDGDPPPQPAPERLPTPSPQPAGAGDTTLRLAGTVPPEVWNRLGIRLLPKLRSAKELSVGIDLAVTVDARSRPELETELRQALLDLGLSDRVRVEHHAP